MSGTKQIGLSAFTPHPPEKTISERITEFLRGQDGHKWSGTAFMLCKELGYSINSPRALAVRLKNEYNSLQKCGVDVKAKVVHGSRILTLSLSRRAAEAAIKQPEKGEPSGWGKIIAEPEPAITFPWSWQYARLEELTEDEKREQNEFYTVGKIRTRRVCEGCGAPGRGKLEFRKRCTGYPDKYLCRACSLHYVKQSRRVMQRLGGDNHEEVPTK